MNIYWYAPFNNADELTIARHVQASGDTLVIHALASRFGRPVPLAPGDPFELIRDLPEPAGEDGRHPSRRRRLGVAAERAWLRDRLVRRRKFDLLHIHTYNMFTDWLALPALRRTAPTMVGTVHNVLPHDRRGPAVVERWLHRTGYRTFDHLFVAHGHLRDMLITDFDVASEQISVVPLPVVPVPQPNQCRDPDRPEFLFFGTLRHNKGIPVLLDAISHIAEPDIRFRFAGRGSADLESLVASAARHDDRIIAELGFVTDERKAELLRTAWAVVLPYTTFDAQSGVLQDAYAYGLPVIATTVGALGSAIVEEATGWTVEPGDAEQLADCITTVASADHDRAAASARINDIAVQRTPELIATALREDYDLVEQRQTHRGLA